MAVSGATTGATANAERRSGPVVEETKQSLAFGATAVGLATIAAYVGLSVQLGAGFGIVVGILLVCGGTFLGVLRGPVGRAWARRIDSDRGGAVTAEELDLLHARIEDLESGHQRMAELEERLDFAERLLTRSREESRAPEGEG